MPCQTRRRSSSKATSWFLWLYYPSFTQVHVCVCVWSCLGTGVSDEGAEGHCSHLLLSCPAEPAQQQPQIPPLPHPLVQILISHQQLQSHLSAATCQSKSAQLPDSCLLRVEKECVFLYLGVFYKIKHAKCSPTSPGSVPPTPVTNRKHFEKPPSFQLLQVAAAFVMLSGRCQRVGTQTRGAWKHTERNAVQHLLIP